MLSSSSNETVLQQPLAGGLLMRTAANTSDVERVAEFNAIIHGAGVAPMTRHLFLDHPNTSGRDLIFVEDPATGQVVSSICLIPWNWRYDGIAVLAGEMGIVGTLEAYRRRGLVRQQVTFFKQRLRERGCLISHIQGIPYYYRQFGYEYALPLEGGLRMLLHGGPKPPATPFQFRLATDADLPAMMRMYDEAAQDVALSVVRSEAEWRYLRTCTAGSEMACEDWLIDDGARRPAGYFRLPLTHFGEELTINEVSRLSMDAAVATLCHLKTLAEERNKPGLRLNLPAASALVAVGRQFTDREFSTYAWQIHVPDMTALLRTLTPVLERRLAASPLAGLSVELPICLYCETIRLRFEQGRLVDVANVGPTERGPVNIPPLQFIPIVLGYKSLEEQRRCLSRHRCCAVIPPADEHAVPEHGVVPVYDLLSNKQQRMIYGRSPPPIDRRGRYRSGSGAYCLLQRCRHGYRHHPAGL